MSSSAEYGEVSGARGLALDSFNFILPDERIAREPARPRDSSRLMLLSAASVYPGHHVFTDLPMLLRAGDLLVLNHTQVMPARLHVRRLSGGRVELLLHRPVDAPLRHALVWEALGRPGSALQPGSVLIGPLGWRLMVAARVGQMVQIRGEKPLWDLMQQAGSLPLPPYVGRSARPSDAADYQSIFADHPGAVAAPTASLHFTQQVFSALKDRGVRTCSIVLHVGPGTFLPIRAEHTGDVRQHEMHPEAYDVPMAAQEALRQTRAQGGRVIAVGTTSLRAIETYTHTGLSRGESRLFIYPGFQFAGVDGLLTNFHLPRSTLLLLVCAMAGRERILSAYRDAVARQYRFYSFGDAMLIFRGARDRAT